MCAVMEENKQNLEFIAPEVKVVSVASQGVLCESEIKLQAQPLESYQNVGLPSYDTHEL